MKHFYILFFLFSSIGVAQIPSDYYDSANGLNGFALKTELKNITTNGHFWSTNSPDSYDELYIAYVNTHSDVMTSSGNQYESDDTILDFYSEEPLGTDPYNYDHGMDQCGNQTMEGDCYNREHLVPQSSFGSAYPMQSDIHHVIPTDGRVNNFRGSLPFGEANDDDWESLNGSLRGSSAMAGYSGSVFEPIDEFKGDIARALLYFATRYEDTVDGYTSFDMFNGSNDQVFETWAIDVLLNWHYNVDPVDQRERDRNEAAYTFQGNANPFVDHPEYANMIWNPSTDTEAPTAPTNLMASNPTDNTIDLSWTASTDNIGVTSYDIYVDNVNTYNTTATSFIANNLSASTNYCFTVKAKDAAGNESAFSNQACEMTTNNGSGGMADLFFSEYLEGSGTNKALEIANFTGASVNLSIYTLKLASNSNNFSTTYTFPVGSIADGDVFVVANSGLSAACQPQQDDVNNSITGFNGNDAIGLFKNDVLIDILGIEASGTTFGENVTLVRKPEIEFPTTTFNINEWNMEAQNDCSDLGMHNQTLGVEEVSTLNISVFPNPVKGTILNINSNTQLTITVYDMLGKQVLTIYKDVATNTINISPLKQGIYFLKITSDSGSVVKKLIKQ